MGALVPALIESVPGREGHPQGVPLQQDQDFLTLWKDADPDIPILKQAKAEYAKLQL